MIKKEVVILGVTGSIGVQALDVIRAFPDYFSLKGMSGYSNITLLTQIAQEFKPSYITVSSEDFKSNLLAGLDYKPVVFVGEQGLVDLVICDMDLLVVAIVGTAALLPVVAAIPCVNHICIANKEVLVAAGDIIMNLVRDQGTHFIPVDSEHSAIFQCLAAVNFNFDFVSHVTLTASGGPFLTRDLSSFDLIQPEDALKHPNWDMGAKISIDSATMANKGLEVIEAHHLFGLSYDDIDVVIHPKSIVHSFIETIDGAIFSHMGRPDMRYPIQYAMTYPNRFKTPFKQDPLHELSDLTFFEPDYNRFPLLKLALECGRNGGAQPAVFNAANEVAVQLFLKGEISFLGMFDFIESKVSQFGSYKLSSIDDIILLDTSIKNQLSTFH